MKKRKDGKIAVIVTTEHRGVFFGFIEPEDVDKDPIKIYEKQMCTYYSKDMHGVFGLAKFGPSSDCRIGSPVDWAIVKKVTSVVSCSDEAVENWKKKPWG